MSAIATVKISVPVDIPTKRAKDILITAIESSYGWARWIKASDIVAPTYDRYDLSLCSSLFAILFELLMQLPSDTIFLRLGQFAAPLFIIQQNLVNAGHFRGLK